MQLFRCNENLFASKGREPNHRTSSFHPEISRLGGQGIPSVAFLCTPLCPLWSNLLLPLPTLRSLDESGEPV